MKIEKISEWWHYAKELLTIMMSTTPFTITAIYDNNNDKVVRCSRYSYIKHRCLSTQASTVPRGDVLQ